MTNYTDKNGKVINNTDIIFYEGNTYIVLYIEKENKWICHPCGDNINTIDIDLSEIHDKCSLSQE